jgi:hypothetical protein
MAQILGGLITYLLLAIYCHEEYNDKDNITRVRQLPIKMRNELAEMLAEINVHPKRPAFPKIFNHEG